MRERLRGPLGIVARSRGGVVEVRERFLEPSLLGADRAAGDESRRDERPDLVAAVVAEACEQSSKAASASSLRPSRVLATPIE